jgi:hypothetical protein
MYSEQNTCYLKPFLYCETCFAVLQIHDILGWIRIRGSMPLTNGFAIDLQDASKKLIFQQNFLCLLLFEATFTSFFKDKKSKESQNSKNQGFSYNFCMMIEGSGSIPLTSGSGSGRPKNMWIRIRIRNTAALCTMFLCFSLICRAHPSPLRRSFLTLSRWD